MKYKIKFNDNESELISLDEIDQLDIFKEIDQKYHILKDNQRYEVLMDSFDVESKTLIYFINNTKYEVIIENELDTLISSLGFNTPEENEMNEIKSPMPGVIVDVLVEVGQTVTEGDQLVVLEAMKMENMLKSHGTGIIESMHINKGDAVEKDQILISFEIEAE